MCLDENNWWLRLGQPTPPHVAAGGVLWTIFEPPCSTEASNYEEGWRRLCQPTQPAVPAGVLWTIFEPPLLAA